MEVCHFQTDSAEQSCWSSTPLPWPDVWGFFLLQEKEKLVVAGARLSALHLRAGFAGLHKGGYPLPAFNQSQWDGMGFIALWWRALLWRWTVTLLSKWNHRLASIPREKAHLLSTGECSRGGYARWRLHAFSTQLHCIGIHLWLEKTDYVKAKVTYDIDFEYHSLLHQQSKTATHTHTPVYACLCMCADMLTIFCLYTVSVR